jgi:hypothetical protein
MARSLIGENQVRDEEFLSEEEHRTEVQHYLTGLADVATISGAEGKYLRATASGAEWVTISGSGYDDSVVVFRDGTQGFFSTVSGIDPTEDYHLATKLYVDIATQDITQNLDGGVAASVYGGTSGADAGDAATVY